MIRTASPPPVARGLVRSALCAALVASPHASLPAQEPVRPRAGFAESIVFNDPSTAFFSSGFAFGLGEQDLFVPVANTLRRVDPRRPDVFTEPIVLPIGQAFGLVAAPRLAFAVWATEFQTSTLFRVDLLTGAITSRPLPANAFDLVREPISGEILVNANPDFPLPGARTGVWLVDPAGGHAHREVVRLSGPSGPLAFDPLTGDLVVAEIPQQVPPAPGSVRLLRFAAHAVQARCVAGGGSAPPALVPADAIEVVAGLDGAFDLAFEPDTGTFYLSDVNHGLIHRGAAGSLALEPTPFAGPAGDQITTLAFSAFASAPFAAYGRPADDTALYVLGVTSSRGAAVHAVRPARPRLDATPGIEVAPGPFAIALSGLPAAAASWLLISVGPPTAGELALPLTPNRPLWLGIDPGAPLLLAPTVTDGTGAATFSFTHSAGGPFEFTLQALAFDAGPLVSNPALVSSSPSHLRLIP